MNTEKQNIEELQKAMHGAIDALFALRDAADKMKKKPNHPKGGIAHAEPDPHYFCANARANDMSNVEIGMAKEIEHLREENRELRESNERLQKESAELKERNDELSSRVHSMQNTIMELQQTVEYLNPTFSNIRQGESPFVHFKRVATPLIKYLAENHHPHMQATVTSTSADLWEGHISLPNIHEHLDNND